MRPGLYLVHKPVGVTSFSIVKELTTEVASLPSPLPLCHGGTLDPFAEGLLVILTGQTTRLMDLLHEAPKRYIADVMWGAETDTGDAGGRTVSTGDATALDAVSLDAALKPFLGWTEQIPPATSAKKIGGEPAYRKAHRGEEVVLPPSRVYLHSARWLSHDLPRKSTLEILCRGGYYVRALARDVGRAVGVGAHLSTLKRTSIGPWTDPPDRERPWIHGEALFPWLPSRTLTSLELEDLRAGRTGARGAIDAPPYSFPPAFPQPDEPIRALHAGSSRRHASHAGGPARRRQPSARWLVSSTEALVAHTIVASPLLVPELKLHLITSQCALWHATEADALAVGLPEPYWAFAWPGGQALARYVLDNPALVGGRTVVDFGSGSALAGLAATLGGAREVLAADLDPNAALAATLNARLNGLDAPQTTTEDLLGAPLDADVVLAGDVFYDRELAARTHEWLRTLARRGTLALIGDPSRGFLDTSTLERVAAYQTPSDGEIDGLLVKEALVFRVTG